MDSQIACREGPGFHPLELIPFFRRFAPTRARNLVYTLIWSVLIALAMLLAAAAINGRLPTQRTVEVYLVLSSFAGYAIHALFAGGKMFGLEALAIRHGVVAKTVYYTAVPTIGAIAGFQATDWILGIGFANWFRNAGWIISIAATGLIISLIISLVFYAREREAAAQAHAEQIRRETLAANLRALQAQIEPHFLFNTLANVSTLIDRDPATARRMLERFIRFLRASLAATRGDNTTLGAEKELISAYLDVLQVRMGPRLEYRVQVAPDVAGHAIAPMLLQPVVENAIRHGVEPKVEGGRVEFDARREDGAVVIEVRDTGVGFGSTTHGGVGLTNLRDRLRGLYGEAATLSIGENEPCGTRVTIRIPA